MSNAFVGGTRALLGQGVGMGWGDEGEAWLRSKLGDEEYASALQRIRAEQSEFNKAHPFVSGLSEVAGGILPGAAAAFIPGMQPAAATSGARSLGKLAALGSATGAIAGAGASEDTDRSSGMAAGAVLGGAMGAAIPVAMRGAGAGLRWAQERVAPSTAVINDRAAGRLSDAIGKSNMTPQQIEQALAQDRGLGVPSVLGNASPRLAKLTQGVAKTGGDASEKIEKELTAQRMGTGERVYGQVAKALKPGNYYDDLADLQQGMRAKAAPLYDEAYAHGEVNDPEVLKFMQLPQFQQGAKKAQELLAAEGRKVDMSKPTVEVLDQVKRGLDSLIEGQTDAVTGKTTSLGRVYTQKKNEFLDALDKAVPKYAEARAVYRGDAELMDAMRKGLNEFGGMDYEQVAKTAAKMSAAEKQAFRTGVARNLYGEIMRPSGNSNAGQRAFGGGEKQAKLQALFDNPDEFKLFKTAMQREAQLFNQSGRILGGSDTAENLAMAKMLQETGGVADAIGDAISGGFRGGLTGMALNFVRAGTAPQKTMSKMADMLMSKDPNEVAAVVKLLEEHSAAAAPKALKSGVRESGAVTAATTSVWPSGGEGEKKPGKYDIEADLKESAPEPKRYNIEDDL